MKKGSKSKGKSKSKSSMKNRLPSDKEEMRKLKRALSKFIPPDPKIKKG